MKTAPRPRPTTAPAIIALALALMLAAGCKEEGDSFKDPRDGKEYKTVNIGEQVWMAENLNYEAEGSKCYDNKPENCAKYGRLYDWETAMKACPQGWRLPGIKEWSVLNMYIEKDKNCSQCNAKHLKAKKGWDNNGNGTDSYGFSAVAGGFGYDKDFYDIGSNGCLWSTEEFHDVVEWNPLKEDEEDVTTENAISFGIYSHEEFSDYNADDNSRSKSSFISVRCVKD